MPDTCMHDRDEECCHNCPDCSRFEVLCPDCGEEISVEDAEKYILATASGKEPFCFDCFFERVKEYHWMDFFNDNEEALSQLKEYVAEIYKN